MKMSGKQKFLGVPGIMRRIPHRYPFLNLDEPDGSIGPKALLTAINLRLDRPVIPGDQLVLKAKLIKRLGQLSKISTQAMVDGVVVANAELTVAMTEGGGP